MADLKNPVVSQSNGASDPTERFDPVARALVVIVIALVRGVAGLWLPTTQPYLLLPSEVILGVAVAAASLWLVAFVTFRPERSNFWRAFGTAPLALVESVLVPALVATLLLETFWLVLHVSLRELPSPWGLVSGFVLVLLAGRLVGVMLKLIAQPISLSARTIEVLFRLASVQPSEDRPKCQREHDDKSAGHDRTSNEHSEGSTDAATVLLLSDTHFVFPGGPEPMDGSHTVEENIRHIASKAHAANPDLLIHCGDVTDIGDDASWKEAASSLSQALARVPVLMVPGNHDVHFHGLTGKKRPWRQHSPVPEARLVARTRELLGQEHSKHLHSAGESYPLLFSHRHFDVLVLNSNRRVSGSAVSNAFGLVGAEQLGAARVLALGRKVAKPLIIALHHHLVVANSPGWGPGLSNLFLTCLDSPEVLKFARDAGSIAIVHGHQHMPYCVAGAPPDPLIVSCGSAAYAAKGPFRAELRRPSGYLLQFGSTGLVAKLLIAENASPAAESKVGTFAARLFSFAGRAIRFTAGLVGLGLVLSLGSFVIAQAHGPLVPKDADRSPIEVTVTGGRERSEAKVAELRRFLDETCSEHQKIARSLGFLAKETDVELFDQGIMHLAGRMLSDKPTSFAPLAWRTLRLVESKRHAHPERTEQMLAQQWAKMSTPSFGQKVEIGTALFPSGRSKCVFRGDPLRDPPMTGVLPGQTSDTEDQ